MHKCKCTPQLLLLYISVVVCWNVVNAVMKHHREFNVYCTLWVTNACRKAITKMVIYFILQPAVKTKKDYTRQHCVRAFIGEGFGLELQKAGNFPYILERFWEFQKVFGNFETFLGTFNCNLIWNVSGNFRKFPGILERFWGFLESF